MFNGASMSIRAISYVTIFKVLLLTMVLYLGVCVGNPVSQSGCRTPEYIETLNKTIIEKRIAHIKGENAIVFVLLDPHWSLPDFDDVPYRHEEDMANIKKELNALIAGGIDEVIVWKFRRPSILGAAVGFKDNCVVSGYGEPDMVGKLTAMHEAFLLIIERGADDPSVRDSIRKVLEHTPYKPDEDKINKVINKIHPLIVR